MKELDKTRRRENRRLPKNSDFPETTRMILKATQIRKKETTTQKTKFFSLQIQMLQNLQDSQLVRGLPYFTNYHIHDYKTSETAPKHLKDRSRMLTAQIPLTTDKKKAT
jgi:hypothetical protein